MKSDGATTPTPTRKAEVLRAATRVFYKKGYAATSIQDVADELGILKGSLYYYIDSKEELLFEIISEAHQRTMDELSAWKALDGGAAPKVEAFLRAHVRIYCQSIEQIGVFLHDFRSLSPDHRREVLEERDQFDRYLRELIHAGQAEGVFRSSLDSKLASMAIFGMLNWISTWWREGGDNSAEEVADQFTSLVLGGLTRADIAPHGDGSGVDP